MKKVARHPLARQNGTCASSTHREEGGGWLFEFNRRQISAGVGGGLKADIASAPMEVYSTSRMASNLVTRRRIEILTSNAHKIRFAVHYFSRGKAPCTAQVRHVTSFLPVPESKQFDH